MLSSNARLLEKLPRAIEKLEQLEGVVPELGGILKPLKAFKRATEESENIVSLKDVGLWDALLKAPGFAALGAGALMFMGLRFAPLRASLSFVDVFAPGFKEQIVKQAQSLFGAWAGKLTAKALGISEEEYEKLGGSTLKRLGEKLKQLTASLAPYASTAKAATRAVASVLQKIHSTVRDFFVRVKESVFGVSPKELLTLLDPFAFAPFLRPVYDKIIDIFKGLASEFFGSLKKYTLGVFAVAGAKLLSILKFLGEKEKKEKTLLERILDTLELLRSRKMKFIYKTGKLLGRGKSWGLGAAAGAFLLFKMRPVLSQYPLLKSAWEFFRDNVLDRILKLFYSLARRLEHLEKQLKQAGIKIKLSVAQPLKKFSQGFKEVTVHIDRFVGFLDTKWGRVLVKTAKFLNELSKFKRFWKTVFLFGAGYLGYKFLSLGDLNKAVAKIEEIAKRVGHAIEKVYNCLSNLVKKVESFASKIKNITSEAFNKAKKFAAEAYKKVTSFLDGAWDRVAEILGTVAEGPLSVFRFFHLTDMKGEDVTNYLKTEFRPSNVLSGVFSGIKNLFVEVGSSVASLIAPAGEVIKDAASKAVKWICSPPSQPKGQEVVRIKPEVPLTATSTESSDTSEIRLKPNYGNWNLSYETVKAHVEGGETAPLLTAHTVLNERKTSAVQSALSVKSAVFSSAVAADGGTTSAASVVVKRRKQNVAAFQGAGVKGEAEEKGTLISGLQLNLLTEKIYSYLKDVKEGGGILQSPAAQATLDWLL